jgi:hypothetical protein
MNEMFLALVAYTTNSCHKNLPQIFTHLNIYLKYSPKYIPLDTKKTKINFFVATTAELVPRQLHPSGGQVLPPRDHRAPRHELGPGVDVMYLHVGQKTETCF